MKLYEPDSGDILIDGKKLSKIDASAVRRQMGMVATDGKRGVCVFRGTLAARTSRYSSDASDGIRRGA